LFSAFAAFRDQTFDPSSRGFHDHGAKSMQPLGTAANQGGGMDGWRLGSWSCALGSWARGLSTGSFCMMSRWRRMHALFAVSSKRAMKLRLIHHSSDVISVTAGTRTWSFPFGE
jgi:hypothetical protein